MFDEIFMESEEGIEFSKWLDKNSHIYYLGREEFNKHEFAIGDLTLHLDNKKSYRLILSEYKEFKNGNK